MEDEDHAEGNRNGQHHPCQEKMPALGDALEVDENENVQSHPTHQQSSANTRRIGIARRHNKEKVDPNRVPVFNFRCVPEAVQEEQEQEDWWDADHGDRASADNSADKAFLQELERYLFTGTHISVHIISSDFLNSFPLLKKKIHRFSVPSIHVSFFSFTKQQLRAALAHEAS